VILKPELVCVKPVIWTLMMTDITVVKQRLTKVNVHMVLVKTTASRKANNVVHGNSYIVIPQPNSNVANVTRVPDFKVADVSVTTLTQ